VEKNSGTSVLSRSLVIVFFSMIVLMTVFEVVKQIIVPSVTLWESHIITIFFTSIVAVILVYLPLRSSLTEQGKIRTLYGQLRDTEKNLRTVEARYRSYVESAEESIYTIDRDLRYLLINPKYNARRGSEDRSLLGRLYAEFHTAAETSRFTALASTVFQLGQSVEDESEHNGRYYHRKFSPVRDPASGSIVAITVISSDVTDLRKTEVRLTDINKKLTLMNTITRHDILNSVAGLLGCVDMAGETTDAGGKCRDLLKDIRAAGLAIREQVLFTREYQEIGMHSPQWQDLADVIRNSARRFETSPVLIVISVQDVVIMADPLLGKVFYNLIDNAIRHGEKIKQIRFSCRISAGGLAILCEDDGSGVAAEEKERIFDLGVGKNTGYGLYLIKEILAITGITIRETGVPGSGARFEIFVPEGLYRAPEI